MQTVPGKQKLTTHIDEYVTALKASRAFGGQVVCHRELPARVGEPGTPASGWPGAISQLLGKLGIRALFSHQARAINLIRQGQHVVLATPTASGKSLVYTLPIIEQALADPDRRALYISPLKALAHDQHRNFERLARLCPGSSLTSAIYDGDTTAWYRKKIRQNPPNIVLTNPEMVHLSILAYHHQWQTLFANLTCIVIDEVHTYRGLLGSHLAQVIRRLQRICHFYGSHPVYIFCSATIANPVDLVKQLTNLDAVAITRSGAPRGRRHVVMLNPADGPVQATIQLLKAALQRGLRTIVYTQSRKLTELMALWVGERSGNFKSRISAYRAGLLPEERRGIERKLATGELLAVISTSALELGIDIGDLDLCILVGYPGSIVATWQRGGRVGRSGQPSALVIVAGEDALDQYFMRNPEVFLNKGPEAAVVNPENPDILKRHVECAAAEAALVKTESYLQNPATARAAKSLVRRARLLESADGERLYAHRKIPHRDVSLRSGGCQYSILCGHTGRHKGDIDGIRVFRETHPGAIYLHQGETLLVQDLDMQQREVRVAAIRSDYYTKVRTTKHTDIIDIYKEKRIGGIQVACGRVRITEQVTGYEKWQIRGRRKMNIVPLDLPPHIFETQGVWFDIPLEIQGVVENNHLHFMGGIHAVEHAAIGIFPLLVMADRNDLGGISTPYHHQVNSAVIFIYDGISGGAGLSHQAFRQIEQLFAKTFESVASCPCENGCPACVHSPKCGSGNRPIDKPAARLILEWMHRQTRMAAVGDKAEHQPAVSAKPEGSPPIAKTEKLSKIRYGVFDIETQLSAQEAGGWHRADRMLVSCVVLYDSKDSIFHEYLEDQVEACIDHLRRLQLVIGFNIKRFDYRVLSGYSQFDFQQLPTLDLLEKVHARLGFRLSLGHLAQETLGTPKSADGLQALRWWKQGKIREIVAYCKKDVEITKDLYLFGREREYLVFRNKAGSQVRVPVVW